MVKTNDLLCKVMAWHTCIAYIMRFKDKYIHVFKQAGGNKAEGLKTQPVAPAHMQEAFLYLSCTWGQRGAGEGNEATLEGPIKLAPRCISLEAHNRFSPQKKIFYTDYVPSEL